MKQHLLQLCQVHQLSHSCGVLSYSSWSFVQGIIILGTFLEKMGTEHNAPNSWIDNFSKCYYFRKLLLLHKEIGKSFWCSFSNDRNCKIASNGLKFSYCLRSFTLHLASQSSISHEKKEHLYYQSQISSFLLLDTTTG